ncbi:ATP phosphoribosyltransferase [Leucothrix arctica]|uniref:ATP phosphoribosyltransferase n=1 Tax=Leucothrix arctica TaxID=1481894 RepID=A0A317C989_9GAMM|nr:ATP phosphoribosyltransferase [Leucothrix arctica]PWQ95265.1 ATP phosphoribosyltransferase [Leucothrix arctica]
MTQTITIALSKGRIYKETMPLLKAAGIEVLDDPETSRKLILDTTNENIKVVIIRATDVPTYVEYGAADLGVIGKDVLMEHGGHGLYEMLDLNIACCKLMTAGFKDTPLPEGQLKVATKFVNCAKDFFSGQGRQIEVIKLYGSMELAPIVGLADCIVDVVDTGNTLRANGLVPQEHIADISSRLVVNKASMKMKHTALQGILDKVSAAVGARK